MLIKYLLHEVTRSTASSLRRIHRFYSSGREFFKYQPPLTVESHPELKRLGDFQKISNDHIQYFEKILGSKSVVTDIEALSVHNMDWSKRYRGSSQLLLKPSSTLQLSQILSYCNSFKLALVPQGGNTGLVGGSVPVFDEIILSLSNLNKISSFDPISGVLVCEAGCILQALDEYLLNEYSHCMPIDLGAKGSCQIGGNVATNAGGVRLLKYGSLHGSVLGLEVVLADGTILNSISTVRKDNTGYDLKQLFIGSEGTLGIITQVAILTAKAPKHTGLVLLAVEDFETVQKILARAKASLNDILSAFEFWDKASADVVFKHHTNLKKDFEHLALPFSVLIETSHFEEATMERISNFVAAMMQDGLCKEGVIAENQSQIQTLWGYRECIPEVCTREGIIYKYDVSLPLPVLYSLVDVMRRRLQGEENVIVVGYGHAGDGNLHLNIMTKERTQRLEALMEPFIYEYIRDHNGSISAEHGLGLMKAEKLKYSKSKAMISVMKSIKRLFDPNNILNPYKVLPIV